MRLDPAIIALREENAELRETIRQLRVDEVIPAWEGLHLTPCERAILSTLATSRGICSQSYLLNRLPSRHEAFLKTIDVHICRLRKKLGAVEPQILIGTVYRQGYLLNDRNCALLAERLVKREGNSQ